MTFLYLLAGGTNLHLGLTVVDRKGGRRIGVDAIQTSLLNANDGTVRRHLNRVILPQFRGFQHRFSAGDFKLGHGWRGSGHANRGVIADAQKNARRKQNLNLRFSGAGRKHLVNEEHGVAQFAGAIFTAGNRGGSLAVAHHRGLPRSRGLRDCACGAGEKTAEDLCRSTPYEFHEFLLYRATNDGQ